MASGQNLDLLVAFGRNQLEAVVQILLEGEILLAEMGLQPPSVGIVVVLVVVESGPQSQVWVDLDFGVGIGIAVVLAAPGLALVGAGFGGLEFVELLAALGSKVVGFWVPEDNSEGENWPAGKVVVGMLAEGSSDLLDKSEAFVDRDLIEIVPGRSEEDTVLEPSGLVPWGKRLRLPEPRLNFEVHIPPH